MLSVFFVVQAYCGFAHGYEEAVLRMDDNIKYFEYQNIVNAVKMSKSPWLYGHNFAKDDKNTAIEKELLALTKTCIYFTKQSVDETNVNFTKHSMKDQEMKPTPLYGKFFTTPGIGNNSEPTKRSAPNAITVSYPGGQALGSYKLIYSNNKDCSILRPFPLEQFGQTPLLAEPNTPVQQVPGLSYYDPRYNYYKSTKKICIVLLSDDKARSTGLPPVCKATFDNMCGKGRELTVIFNKTCPRMENPLGC